VIYKGGRLDILVGSNDPALPKVRKDQFLEEYPLDVCRINYGFDCAGYSCFRRSGCGVLSDFVCIRVRGQTQFIEDSFLNNV